MKFQISHTLFFFFLLYILTLAPTNQSLNTKTQYDLQQRICKLTTNYNLCLSLLNTNPLSKNDAREVAQAALGTTLNQLNGTLAFVGELVSNTTDPPLRQLYQLCLDKYKDAVTVQMPDAIKAFNVNNYVITIRDVINAAGDVTQCNNQLLEKAPALTRKNNYMELILNVTLKIVALLL